MEVIRANQKGCGPKYMLARNFTMLDNNSQIILPFRSRLSLMYE